MNFLQNILNHVADTSPFLVALQMRRSSDPEGEAKVLKILWRIAVSFIPVFMMGFGLYLALNDKLNTTITLLNERNSVTLEFRNHVARKFDQLDTKDSDQDSRINKQEVELARMRNK
jgi:hypothetical protein